MFAQDFAGMWIANKYLFHTSEECNRTEMQDHHPKPRYPLVGRCFFDGWCCGDIPTRATVRIHPHISDQDRKSTRLNSSHVAISYAVFCLKKKNTIKILYLKL